MQIYIYYRTYWNRGDSDGWCGKNILAKNKMEMVETCISSMGLNDLDLNKIAFVDNSTSLYTKFLKTKFDNVIHTNEGLDARDSINGWPIINMIGSYYIMLKYMMKQNYNDDDIILVVEDDYLFAPKAINKWIEAIKELGGFVSPFDHPDRYIRNDDQYARKTRIQIVAEHHWRQAEATTGTFGAEFKVFKKTNFLRYIPRFRIRGIYSARLFGRELPGIDRVFMRRAHYLLGINLHTPIPGIACHLSKFIPPHKKHIKKNAAIPETQLSPGYNWKKRYSEVLAGI